MSDASLDSVEFSNRRLLSEMRKWDAEYLKLMAEQAKLNAEAAKLRLDRLLAPLAVFGVLAGAVGGLVVVLFRGVGH